MLGWVLGWMPSSTRQQLRGKALGHPLHPMMTDVPIGLWTSSLVLDALGGAEQSADRLLRLGIVAAMPTAIVGWLDWAESSRPARRQGLVHAAANNAAIWLFTASAIARRTNRGRGKRLSALAALALGVGGYLGGHLAYVEGVGVEGHAAVEPAGPPEAPARA